MDYGEEWRVCRKMMHHEFHATAFKKYRPVLTQHAREFIQRVTKKPVTHVSGYLKQYALLPLRRLNANLHVFCSMTGANIMQVVYGIDVLPEHDPFIELAEVALEAFSECAIDFHLVEVLPLRASFMVTCNDTPPHRHMFRS